MRTALFAPKLLFFTNKKIKILQLKEKFVFTKKMIKNSQISSNLRVVVSEKFRSAAANTNIFPISNFVLNVFLILANNYELKTKFRTKILM